MNWFHRHKWKIVSAHCDGRLHYHDPGDFHPIIVTEITEIVTRCDCGKFRSQQLPGKHSIEDLRGEDPEISAIPKTIK